MAVSACVVTGTLNADTTAASFTRSGFGTPEAALVFVGRANTGGNPTTTAAMSIGFWDGTNQYCAAVVSNDAVGDSDTARRRLNNRIAADISISGSTVGNLFQAQLATTTDGVTITITDDNTTVSRYATVVLFKGLSSKKLGNFTFAGDTSAIDVTTVGFKPDLVFYCDVVDGAAWTTSPSDQTDGALLIFGAAHNDSTDTITQGSILYSAVDALGSSRVNLSTGNTIGRQGFYDSNWFSHTISAFDSSGFTVTPSLASASRPMFLALEFDNPDDAYVGIVDSKTSTGTQAHTGTGFTPQILILASTGGTTVNGSSSSPTGSFFIGAGDSTAEQALVISDEDAQGTTDTESYANTSNILALRFHGGTTDAIADIDSLDSDGWTLNYSDGSSSTIKILAIAVGNSGGGTTTSATDPGAITVTGTAATSTRHLLSTTSPGAITVTGVAATSARRLVSTTSPGQITVTGTPATSLRALLSPTSPGAITVTGSAATSTRSLLSITSPGAITVTGVAATSTYTPVGTITSEASPGAITVTGVAATSTWAHLSATQPGQITVSGFAATSLKAIISATQPGVLTVTGFASYGTWDHLSGTTPGAITVTGYEATSTATGNITLTQADLDAIAAAVWADPAAVAAHAKLDAIIARITC